MAEKFVSWLTSHGGSLHPDLDFFHELPGSDRGVVSRKAIKEGDTLIRVPLDICLHMPTVDDGTEVDEVVDFLLKLEGRPSPFISTVLQFLHHQTRVRVSLGP